MKILITGAVGFIGSHLAERMLELGHEVVGIDCYSDYYSPKRKRQNAEIVERKGGKIHELDLSKDDISSAVTGADVAYHLAAQPGISNSVTFEKYLVNNIVATENLLRAVESNARDIQLFVNVATSSVYGKHATGNEETPPTPASHYGVTKLAAEQAVLARARDKGLPACSVRPFSVYGERERPEKMFTKLIESILKDATFPLFEGSAEHRRSYTYVGDIVDGLVAVIENKERAIGEIFNLGTEEVITTGEGIAIVEDILAKKAKIEIVPKRAGDQQETSANIEKAKRMLGYMPKVAAREGLRRQVEWAKNTLDSSK